MGTDERPANVPRKTKDSLDQALDIIAGLRNKLERMDEFFDQWGEEFQQQDWRHIRVAIADIEVMMMHARAGIWYRRGGTDRLGELYTNDKHRRTPGDRG